MEEAQENLQRIEEILQQVKAAKQGMLDNLGPEFIMAIEVMKSFDKIENDMKQLRGQILEYVV